mgnify:CR=1 FL=1
MNLKLQKKLASKVANVGLDKIKFDPEAGEELKEAITKEDIRSLINEGVIKIKSSSGVSRFRAKIKSSQKKKGRRRGQGTRKGSKSARVDTKRRWINQVRSQRGLLKKLKEKGEIKQKDYRDAYKKVKGNFFRSKRHLLLHLEKNEMISKKK